jgi:hypothetical protein
MKKNSKEIDQEKMTYYNQFQDHAKKFMMDFKVSKQADNNANNEEAKKLPPTMI